MQRTRWTEEMEQFLIDNYEGKDCIELAKLINDKFNTNFTNWKISNKKAIIMGKFLKLFRFLIIS